MAAPRSRLRSVAGVPSTGRRGDIPAWRVAVTAAVDREPDVSWQVVERGGKLSGACPVTACGGSGDCAFVGVAEVVSVGVRRQAE
jgi:hypothetical protein